MPPLFAHPDSRAPGPGMTFYRGLSGKSAFFDPEVKEGVSMATITDGTSNTLAVVEAKEAVPWTKPGTEIAVQPPRPGVSGGALAGRSSGGTRSGQIPGASSTGRCD